MKRSYSIVLGLGVLLGACQAEAPAEDETVQMINPKDIQVGPTRHDSLTAGQLARVTRIQATFAEVYSVSLAQTIENFRRDADPDRELAVWETMATAYEQYLRRQPRALGQPQKKEVFALLLSRSMMPAADAIANARLVHLSPAEARQVLALYEAAPAPLHTR